jgi:hypothetical protein
MRWSDFEREAPELASIGRQSFESYEVIVLATNRLEGSPRLWLVTPLLLDDALFIATRAGDAKTKDLERDSRCSIHSLVSHRTHTDRAFTAEALARPVGDSVRRAHLLERAHRPEISWFPDAIHELDITSARSVGGAPKPRLVWRAAAH